MSKKLDPTDPFAELDLGEPVIQEKTIRVDPEIIAQVDAQVKHELNTLQGSLDNYDATTATTADVRRTLMNKLMPSVMKLDLDVTKGTDPEIYAAQTKLLGEMRQLLNDMDSSAQKHVAVKLKKKDSEVQEANAINAAELFKHIKLGSTIMDINIPNLTEDVVNDAIKKQFDDNGCIVLDTELIENDSQLPEKRVSDEL